MATPRELIDRARLTCEAAIIKAQEEGLSCIPNPLDSGDFAIEAYDRMEIREYLQKTYSVEMITRPTDWGWLESVLKWEPVPPVNMSPAEETPPADFGYLP